MRRALPLFAIVLVAGCGGGGGRSGTATAGGCREVGAPRGRSPELEAPRQTLDPSKTYVLDLVTSCGAFAVTLDPRLAPHATASLVVLAKAGYFDRTTFHRVVPGFVVQGGDPTGTGGGGPGYSTVDPPPAHASYTRGTVAMAKTPEAPAGAAGSQFFIVTAKDAGLPPDYAIVGRVSQGYDTVRRIEALGDATTEQPSRTVLLQHMSVEVR